MIRFECDYGEGAHPRLLERLTETNMEQTPGYGTDVHCARARELLRQRCGREDADIHLMIGGTQTNATVIAAALRPHQGVLCAATGHIGVHESGAVEATGHKVLPLPTTDGKISAGQIRDAVSAHRADSDHEHMVQPAMVYLSFPTETGMLYSKAELTGIAGVCREMGLLLYLDGARLGYGLMSEKNDLTLCDIAALTDAFYIGGTKQGMLFGEALVLTNDALKRDFRYILKQHCGMLAKGRLLGVQFCAMFEDDLYFDLARQADLLAMKLRRAFEEKGYPLLYDSYTNQQFPILPDAHLARLKEHYSFSDWGHTDADHTAVRFCTGWATRPEAVDALIGDIKRL